MSTDPLTVFRSDLVDAAERAIRLRERRRRLSIGVAVAASAILLVGGAIAAETGLLSADSSGTVELHTGRRVFDHLTPRFKSCMAARGARPVKVQGGWAFADASAETACGAYVVEVTVRCDQAQSPAGQPTPMTTKCVSIGHMNIGPPPPARKEKRK